MQIHLDTPVEVTAKSGEVELSEFLNIQEPNMINLGNVAMLQSIAAKATTTFGSMASSMNKEAVEAAKEESKDEEMDGETALTVLKMGGVYPDAIAEFKKFLLKFGTFDDIKVQTGSMDRMDVKDFEKALGDYFAGFCF